MAETMSSPKPTSEKMSVEEALSRIHSEYDRMDTLWNNLLEEEKGIDRSKEEEATFHHWRNVIENKRERAQRREQAATEATRLNHAGQAVRSAERAIEDFKDAVRHYMSHERPEKRHRYGSVSSVSSLEEEALPHMGSSFSVKAAQEVPWAQGESDVHEAMQQIQTKWKTTKKHMLDLLAQEKKEDRQGRNTPERKSERKILLNRYDRARRRYHDVLYTKPSIAGKTLRACQRALLNFENAVNAYVNHDSKKLKERLSSSSSSSDGEENAANKDARPSVRSGVARQMRAAWRQAEGMWSNVKDQEQVEKSKGEMEQGRQELLAAVEEKRRLAHERYVQAKQQGSENWEAAKNSVNQAIDDFAQTANRFLGRGQKKTASEGQSTHV